ncbi:hypothetical protein ACIPH4_24510 [Streptomyces tendae]|uniref:hypothetical protein n=1 Tax=Streptomyces tendae TaxID=1932 RepID=UPI00381F1744
MNVDDVVAERIAAARRRAEADKRRRQELADARQHGLAARHAQKLQRQGGLNDITEAEAAGSVGFLAKCLAHLRAGHDIDGLETGLVCTVAPTQLEVDHARRMADVLERWPARPPLPDVDRRPDETERTPS